MKNKKEGSTSLPAASSAPRVSPGDIQAKEFRIARFRGYKERDVDEFLDQLTLAWGNVLEENRRLREGSTSTGSSVGIGGDAEGILSTARREADRIVREARERAAAIEAGGSPSGDRQAVSAFLGKEREFLQSLATLVQGHAEGVKGMAREVFAARTESPVPAAPAVATEPVVRESAPVEPEPRDAEPSAPEVSEPEPTEPEPIRVEEPEPVAVSREAEPRVDGDRSLRELFWGED